MKASKVNVKTYYQLTKPGIIYGNAITAIGGFLLASKGSVNFLLLCATIAGISLVIASGCVFNNYIDRGIDKKMARTKSRTLANNLIPEKHALLYAAILGLIGFTILIVRTNALTTLIGLIGLVDYVVLYAVSKRMGPFGTIIGSVSGAMPIVGGYTAVTNRFDMAAVLLFLILVFWQMPHFYAIAMRRSRDYKVAGLPVLPVKKGFRYTKFHIVFYVSAFIIATACLTLLGYTGYVFLGVMSVLGFIWLFKGLQGFSSLDDTTWAYGMFKFSLVVIMSLSGMLAIANFLP